MKSESAKAVEQNHFQSNPLQFFLLCALYTTALVLLTAAYRAQTKEKANFRINFEYRVF